MVDATCGEAASPPVREDRVRRARTAWLDEIVGEISDTPMKALGYGTFNKVWQQVDAASSPQYHPPASVAPPD